MTKLDMHSVSLKVRDIQVWQPSMAPALVSVAGKNTPKLIHETVQQLHAELSQTRGAIRRHQFNGF